MHRFRLGSSIIICDVMLASMPGFCHYQWWLELIELSVLAWKSVFFFSPDFNSLIYRKSVLTPKLE